MYVLHLKLIMKLLFKNNIFRYRFTVELQTFRDLLDKKLSNESSRVGLGLP